MSPTAVTPADGARRTDNGADAELLQADGRLSGVLPGVYGLRGGASGWVTRPVDPRSRLLRNLRLQRLHVLTVGPLRRGGASRHERRRDRALPAVRVRGRPASGRPPVCPRGGREPRAAFGRGARGGAKRWLHRRADRRDGRHRDPRYLHQLHERLYGDRGGPSGPRADGRRLDTGGTRAKPTAGVLTKPS